MKKIFVLVLALTSAALFAHSIEGTLVLKGSLKTKLDVKGVKTTCKASVDKVKNLMEEDSFGNPAYKLKLDVSLNGSDTKKKIDIKLDRQYELTNLFRVKKTTKVNDFEYASVDGALLRIKEDGRIKSVSFPFEAQTVTCSF